MMNCIGSGHWHWRSIPIAHTHTHNQLSCGNHGLMYLSISHISKQIMQSAAQDPAVPERNTRKHFSCYMKEPEI